MGLERLSSWGGFYYEEDFWLVVGTGEDVVLRIMAVG